MSTLGSSARLMHIELACRHHKMMWLMVPALNHYAHKAKRL
jgi:hypothetical protein